MKKICVLLFVIIISGLVLSACEPKVEENTTSNIQIQGDMVTYESDMYLYHPETIAMVTFNYVIVSAAEGTELSYQKDMGEVSVKGNGTNLMEITLVTAPSQVEILVTKCPQDKCPAKVYFVHLSLYPTP
jgi:hypothetical protein